MSTSNNALGYPKLQTKTPVPSDIEISQQIVKEVGLLSMEEVARQLRIILDRQCTNRSLSPSHTHTLNPSLSCCCSFHFLLFLLMQTRPGPDQRRNHSVGDCQSQSTARGI
jgi:hypothetical protein